MPFRDPELDDALLREQLGAIYNASLDAIMTFDPDGSIRTANDAAHEMFGYARGTLPGKRVGDLMPDDYAATEAKSLERDGTTTMIQLLNRIVKREGRRGDGEMVPFTGYVQQLTSVPPHQYILIAEDMTAVSKAHRRITELHEELQEANRNLARKVEERTAQVEKTAVALTEANKRLALEVREREGITRALQRREVQLERLLFKERELSELRSRFVSMASHEFRTPLTAMLSSAEVIAMATEGASPMVGKHIERIRQNIGHLRSILEDFLQVGKLDIKGVDLRICEIHLADFFEDAIQEARLIAPSDQEIELVGAGGLGTAQQSDNGLRVVLSNLIGNAVKYSPAGAPVAVAIETDGERLRVHVTDGGIGIPPDDRPYLFERFFRASNAEHVKGTGLGLHISRQYVHAMGGEIECADNPAGPGTRFTVTVPLHLAEPAAP